MNPITITGLLPGPSVLITAGMDGDEYAGIETAKQLISRFKKIPLQKGTLTIIPCVNTAGNANKTSYHPVDQKYPKFVFPGNPHGTITEREMDFLNTKYVQHANVWIDLHGGNTNEQMTPFVWVYRSKNKKRNAFYTALFDTRTIETIVFDRQPFMTYSHYLERKNIAYVLMECGQTGNVQPSDVTTLTDWVDACLSSLSVISHIKKGTKKPTLYSRVIYSYSITDKPDPSWKLLWKRIDPFVPRGHLYAAYATL